MFWNDQNIHTKTGCRSGSWNHLFPAVHREDELMQKNVAGQKWRVFAFDRTSQVPKTGDAANITAVIRIDGGASSATNDVNPTEISDGFYAFDLTQAETNGSEVLIIPSSVTSDIQVIGCPALQITTPASWPSDVVQTGDSFARIGAAGAGLTNLGDTRIANLDTTVSSRLAPAGTLANVTTVNGLANGVITASSIASDAITASKVAADVSAEIADAVWNEDYASHTSAGTFGKLLDILRKANLSVDGATSGTPTVNTFDTNLTAATGTYDHQLLVFTSGNLEGVSRPILSYTQTNGVIVLQEDLPSAPSASDEFTILVQHVHPVSEIQDGLATQASVDVIDGIVDDILVDTNNLETNLATVDTWVKRNSVILSGIVTGAGTSTEVFTISTLSITATITADAAGNRSSVVWS